MMKVSPILRMLLACVAAVALVRTVKAETVVAPAPATVPADLATFFIGDWTGEGAFASGKPITADASFCLDLDGRWLQWRHADRPPMTFKALGMMGIERTSSKLVMTLFDAGGGIRSFASTGWTRDGITYTRTASSEPVREERFVFTWLSADRFRMEYEVLADGQPWRIVDHLVFRRSSTK